MAPKPTRVAFTAKFGPDEDGFPLQLISGDELRGAENFDAQVIVENRISRDSQATLLEAQESRDAVADASRRQQEAVTQARREVNDDASTRPAPETPDPAPPSDASRPTVDLEV